MISTTTFALLLSTLLGSCHAGGKLLVFLIDGLRYDYLDDLGSLPGFRAFVENGVKVEYMTPEFPSLSYPNYYSLMTGRNTEEHDMTGNYMWDMESDKEFLMGTNVDSRLPLWWNGSEPIWVTMEKLQRKVHMYHWPGCEVEILGVRPSLCVPYFQNASEKNFTDAVEQALDAFIQDQADMAAVYFEKVDAVGHYFGPNSIQRLGTVLALDAAMQLINKTIVAKNMRENLNIVMFSDHGMSEITNLIELDKHINLTDLIKVLDVGPVVSLWPKPSKFEEIFTVLSAVGNMTTYRKTQIPDRFHYKEGRFVSTLTLVANQGWIITPSISYLPLPANITGDRKYGAHGYDNTLTEMRGIFVAKGPDFKSNFTAKPIRAVDAYNVMCRSLDIKPLPNNGSMKRVQDMFISTSSCSTCLTQQRCVLMLLLLVLGFLL
ncbi:glycerophosphocholine cholinephosphodiesterase ENPP6-like [Engraulis encrasicolus]|uniref:glycerophosphocholine cholinephosphodiesterase ENPP6-like n=1 Tax=Engraulis encrasicolus TaxID=184585 RepID=UPI002FD3D749